MCSDSSRKRRPRNDSSSCSHRSAIYSQRIPLAGLRSLDRLRLHRPRCRWLVHFQKTHTDAGPRRNHHLDRLGDCPNTKRRELGSGRRRAARIRPRNAVGASVKQPEDLTPNEVALAATHGVLRRKEKLEGKRADRPQNGRSTWDNEIEGSCAELWYSKWRERYWSGVSHLKANDCGNEEVRWTQHFSNGGLIVYAHDKDDAKL